LLVAIDFDNPFKKNAAKLCPDLTKVCGNIPLIIGGNIMGADQMKPEPMTKDQLDYIKKEIKKTYLYLISHTGFNPEVIEIMKLAALVDVQRRYGAGEFW
jgi:hypothetical protein